MDFSMIGGRGFAPGREPLDHLAGREHRQAEALSVEAP
jgi:hypothetical protein